MEEIKIEQVFEEEMEVQINGQRKKILELTMKENTYLNVYWDNLKEGELNLIDGIDCPICKNKGWIAKVDKNGWDYLVDCECKKQRKTISRLNNCGISKDMLEHYTFKNYICDDNWQKNIKQKFIEYCKEISEGKKSWLYYGGISGSGKTHLCTATFQRLIKSNMQGHYMLWNRDIPSILALEKSSYDDNQIKYAEKIKFLETVELLYIDDFLKLNEIKYNISSLSLAYKIINSRYINNKITIISSEYLVSKLAELDLATYGRIREKCAMGKYMIDCGEDSSRNYRKRKKE